MRQQATVGWLLMQQSAGLQGGHVALWDVEGRDRPWHLVCHHCKGAPTMAKASKKDIKKKIAARLEKIAKHEGKIKKLKKALK